MLKARNKIVYFILKIHQQGATPDECHQTKYKESISEHLLTGLIKLSP